MKQKTIIIERNDWCIEELENLKEAKEYINDSLEAIKNYNDKDTTVAITYKDNSIYYLSNCIEEGTFKTTNIKQVVIDNGCTYQVYGEYTPRIENECLYID